MSLLKALIIDDEVDARRTITKYLERYAPEIQPVGEAHSVETGVKAIVHHQPDIVFLDIQMGDGTGFDLLDELEQVDFNVIFTTAFDHYAVKAFRYHAVDYLLKPIDPDAFKDAIRHVATQDKMKMKEKLVAWMTATGTRDKKMSIPSTDGQRFIRLDDIEFIEGDGSYCKIWMADDSKVLISKPLKYFSEKLQDEQPFLRPHKSYIININHVSAYLKEDGGMFQMKNGRTVPISRQKKEEVIERMNIYFL